MDGRERQRVALVTGGAIRLGRAISVGLARAGFDVVVGYRSSATAAHEVRAEIEGAGHRCELAQADLTLPHGAESLVEHARGAFGRLDVVVNSAASFQEARLEDVDADQWDEVMALNVRAPHLVVRAAMDLLRDARGSVVNIVDLSALQAWTRYPHHSVSKAALAHLTRVQARALAPHVRVNAIAPGAVLPPEDWSPDRWSALASAAALERVGAPSDVVEAVVFLVGAEFITGQILAVDGGRLLGPSGPPS
jgi:pteridine reductase